MFVVHTSNSHCQNFTRRAIFRLGIDTLIANILVLLHVSADLSVTNAHALNGARFELLPSLL